MFQLRSAHHSDQDITVVFLPKGQPFPSFGYPKDQCPHPIIYSVYAEWHGSLGHGWFCALCGELNQVG